jgi:hypothetical protein
VAGSSRRFELLDRLDVVPFAAQIEPHSVLFQRSYKAYGSYQTDNLFLGIVSSLEMWYIVCEPNRELVCRALTEARDKK